MSRQIATGGAESLPGLDTPDGDAQAVSANRSTKRAPSAIVCNGCDATWTALGAAHCSSCHRTLSTTKLFDKHRSERGDRGTCLTPDRLTNAAHERVMFFRDGMWRGPEMPADVLRQVAGGPP